MPEVDACLLGAGMYPGYETYWTALQNEPDKPLPMTGKLPLPEELKWARFIPQTTHYVLSGKLSVLTLAWPTWNSRSNSIATDSDCRPRGCPAKWSTVPRMSRWVKGDIHEAG
jgi:hypothetical protein